MLNLRDEDIQRVESTLLAQRAQNVAKNSVVENTVAKKKPLTQVVECPICLSLNENNQTYCKDCGTRLPRVISHGNNYYLQEGILLFKDRYCIEKLLGTGGFSIAYEGIDLHSSKKVAIKELWPEKAFRQGSSVVWPPSISSKERRSVLRKFQLEAEYQSRCVHPNIVKTYHWFEQNETAYIVMELIQGQSLYQMLQTGGVLSEEKITKYFTQIAEALAVVHNQNFLHRDIKPDNIIVNAQDNAILFDFGSTREFVRGQTHEMSVTLTKGYAPLEQYYYKSKRWPATDLYALCASMYELLTGELPTECVLRVQGEPLVPPRQQHPRISPLMEKIILKGMQMKAEERFQTAQELLSALQGNP